MRADEEEHDMTRGAMAGVLESATLEAAGMSTEDAGDQDVIGFLIERFGEVL
jgi:hypothetical protein